ncbi:hypothetical protein F5Y00DRAFT_160781 [Daldinia vernicosa]|uniref:uncharacterized protein n=1 Tax=Daldinia vernicosa TaxID=114800 RepID=UPI002007278A|nr:uncharacterized protein F5Y00DRAFT_160781 [Daldinia vernicosa]KAI0845809.1 hypothetical protein F5Y00DRAFT_160781 [Daldinia vernicosa]
MASQTPWIPRLHLWEIDDQPCPIQHIFTRCGLPQVYPASLGCLTYLPSPCIATRQGEQQSFPSFLRAYVQDGLTHAWTVHIPFLQRSSPATIVAETLRRELGSSVSRYTYIDFCAGAGGPTPFIERALNSQLARRRDDATHRVPATAQSGVVDGESRAAADNTPSYAAVASPKAQSTTVQEEDSQVDFVLTDLHPHVESWEAASKKSDHLTYVARPVDAASAPADLLRRYTGKKSRKGIFRLFNLAFHHFDDDLARAILKNTVETSDGFGIFELQDRTPTGLLTCFAFGFFIFLIAPLLYWWSPVRLFWVYVIPVVPFVLVFDGLISCLRTRTADEVEALLRTCGANSDGWELKSGKEQFLWPCGYLHWIICTKKAT